MHDCHQSFFSVESGSGLLASHTLTQTYFSVLFFKQNKMEDRLDEAIHVLRNHAVGQTAAMPSNHGDMHGLLGSAPAHSATVGSLGQAFPASVMSLGNRHPSLVSVEASWQLVGTCQGPTSWGRLPSGGTLTLPLV